MMYHMAIATLRLYCRYNINDVPYGNSNTKTVDTTAMMYHMATATLRLYCRYNINDVPYGNSNAKTVL